ncbi:hypothetical protein C7Y47_07360 [Lysinibacillus sphaericus]|uniref:Uncharacterized protein n=1 Tax=Lysinibacillus sphaericus TaxID=1421 RepID=A0A544UQH9_LYSSH|nr:hypothetical protein [Lysinibacillus sp. SDF0037]TQR36085.1 hypothetical protein C7Y47_07360 [Lysinibacillus sp. SDF0037]
MKKLSIIYCEANGKGHVINKFENTIPVLPNVGDKVGLGNAFYKVERRDFVYVEEYNTVEVYIYLN